MNKRHKQRLYYISLFAIGLSLATGFILYALKQNINVFMTPSQVIAAHLPSDYSFRLGGMVKTGSVQHEKNNLNLSFIVTDFKKNMLVHYNGILPDLFREGKGVIAQGALNAEGIFIATQVLAKHDENYMPRRMSQVMEKSKT